MNFDIDEYKNFYERANNHSFRENEGIFINEFKFSRNVITGIDKNNFLVILLPLDKEIAGFQIKDFITLKDNTSFFVENKQVVLKGAPLIYKRKNYQEHFGFLSQINLILDSSEFLINLQQFLDILQKAHNSRNHFKAPSFFAEACTIQNLSSMYPKIANEWDSSANSVIDISSSISNPAIEVKSTTNNDERIHSVSIHQVKYFQKNPSTLLASVIVFFNEEGTSCKSICEKIISKLDETDSGYKYIKGILLAYNDISTFTENCFDEGMTNNNIQFYEPDLKELPLINAPIWLKGGTLKISMDALKLSNIV